MVLGSGEQVLVRIAVVERPTDRDRVYRIRISPTVGGIESEENVIQLLVA